MVDDAIRILEERKRKMSVAEAEQVLRGRRPAAPAPTAPALSEQEPERGPMSDVARAAASGFIPGFEMLSSGMAGLAAGLATPGSLKERIAAAKAAVPEAYAGMAQEEKLAKERMGSGKYAATQVGGMLAQTALLPPAALASLRARAATFGTGGAIRGATRAGMDAEQLPTAGEMVRGGVKGGVAEAAGVLVGERVLPGVGRFIYNRPLIGAPARGVVQTTRDVSQFARRGLADILESPAIQSRLGATAGPLTRDIARFIEPTDLQKVQRVTREELRPTGETAQKYVEQARELTARGKQARQAATQAGAQVREQQFERSLQEAAASRQQAQEVLDRAKARLQEVLPGVTQGPANARALQQSLRAEQVKAGDASYELVRQLGAKPDVNMLVDPLQSAIKNPLMRQAYNDAINKTGASTQSVILKVGNKEKEFLIPGLDGLDSMRTSIREKFVDLISKDRTGAARKQMINLMREVDALEKQYLDALPKEAGDVLKAARSEYRAYFERLEGIQDALNLSRFGVGKQAKLVGPNRRELAELEKKFRTASPEYREAFQVGAADWANNVIAQSPDDALRIANAFVGTPEKARRTRLALGDEATDRLTNVFREVSAAKQASRIVGRPVRAPSAMIGELPIEAQARSASELARQVQMAEAGLGGGEAAESFAQEIAPRMTPQGIQQARNVVTSVLNRQLAKLTPEEAIARLTALQSNPTARKLFGDELKRSVEQLTQPSARSRYVRGGLGAMLTGRVVE